jgi:hypothetical protein
MEEPDDEELIDTKIFKNLFEDKCRVERTIQRLFNYDNRLYGYIIQIINMYNKNKIYCTSLFE